MTQDDIIGDKVHKTYVAKYPEFWMGRNHWVRLHTFKSVYDLQTAKGGTLPACRENAFSFRTPKIRLAYDAWVKDFKPF